MAYPNTNLPGAVDPPFGGRPASEFGGPAWQWLNGVVQFFQSWFVGNQYQPRDTVVVLSSQAAAIGAVAVFVAGNTVPGGGYDVRPYVASLATPRLLGVYLEACSAASAARVCTRGIVPASVSGLGPGAAGDVGLNAATGLLRRAQVGDVLVGTCDVQGNVLLTGYGASLP